jgi:putative FmdB family regulatory protein
MHDQEKDRYPMPIYEFRCLKCHELFEILTARADEAVEMRCPKCAAAEFERVMSATNYSVSGGAGGSSSGASKQSRSCSGGSCTTYEIPGP